MPRKPKRTQRNSQAGGRPIVPGIRISSRNEATVDPEMADVLFDLALKLEDSTGLPVDVQHALAAIVMAARTGEIPADREIDPQDAGLRVTLEKYVRAVFSDLDGQVGEDD